jgi:hypothetical protein
MRTNVRAGVERLEQALTPSPQLVCSTKVDAASSPPIAERPVGMAPTVTGSIRTKRLLSERSVDELLRLGASRASFSPLQLG